MLVALVTRHDGKGRPPLNRHSGTSSAKVKLTEKNVATV